MECFDFKAGPNPETDEDGRFWSYQYCTEMVQPGSRDGGTVPYNILFLNPVAFASTSQFGHGTLDAGYPGVRCDTMDEIIAMTLNLQITFICL